MIIVLYLLKSILAMCIFLSIYKAFFEKEKMHVFNRFYLLATIGLSFLIPLLPTGIITFGRQTSGDSLSSFRGEVSMIDFPMNTVDGSLMSLENVGVIFYFLVLTFFIYRFGRNIILIINSIKNNEKRRLENEVIVLLKERISPFTFMNFIFLNKQDFDGRRIDRQLIDHELTHAKQKHSLDIIFVELMISIFWFNPVLRLYKTAIQLNHEFLADDSVINRYNKVKTYQNLLLDTIQNNNKIYLASNINFHLTQKRLKMMTKKSSSKRKKVLIFSIIPILIGLLMCLGNPAISQNQNNNKQGDPITEKDRYFQHALVHYTSEDGNIKIISYKSLNDEIKSKMRMPPPPPRMPGEEQSKVKNSPLKKGTVLFLSDNGSIFIGSDKDKANMPPPPPPVISSAPVVKGSSNIMPPPPPPISAPKSPVVVGGLVQAPPPPPPPPAPSIDEFLKKGMTIYIDGKKATTKEAREAWGENGDNIKSINVKKDDNGKKTIYLIRK